MAAGACSLLPARVSARAGRTVHQLRGLDGAQYERLLSILDRRFDRTGYWLVRCVRELRLSRKEAVLFEPAVSLGFRGLAMTLRPSETILVWSAKGRAQRPVVLDTREKKALVSALLVWMSERDRQRLGWHDMSVAEMTKRYTNLLGYALKQMRPGGEDVAPETVELISEVHGAGPAAQGDRVVDRASALPVAGADAAQVGR
jgi:hypothetical protein